MGAGKATIDELTERWAAREALSWSGDLAGPALRTAVDALPGATRHIAGYHFGWWDEHGLPGGPAAAPAVRSTVVLVSAQAVGGVPAGALPAAVAVELAHHFSLLHDDVVDGQISRRRRPTAWSVFGLRAAILAGDALLATALEVLAASGHPCAEDGMQVLSAAVLDVVDAQGADIALGTRPGVDVGERMSVAAGKTGALLGCACALGADFGGGDQQQVEHMRRFGEDLGRAFHAGDHSSGRGGPGTVADGGPVRWELYDRRTTMPLVSALTSNTPAGRELAALYEAGTRLSQADLERAARLVDLAGGRAGRQLRPDQLRPDDLVARALQHLESAGLADGAGAELGSLAGLASDGRC